MAPEQEARAEIDKLLTAAGWSIQPRDRVDLTLAQGVLGYFISQQFPLRGPAGFQSSGPLL